MGLSRKWRVPQLPRVRLTEVLKSGNSWSGMSGIWQAQTGIDNAPGVGELIFLRGFDLAKVVGFFVGEQAIPEHGGAFRVAIDVTAAVVE